MTESSSSAPVGSVGVDLRPSTESDAEFLFRVYASSREHEMNMLGDWSAAQKETFLREQFRLQHHQYRTYYPNACYDVIEKDGESIGRLYVEHMKNEIRVMDITLLPEYRDRGIGRALMKDVLRKAARVRKFVSLHVEDSNPAKRLYERMGFVEVGEVSFYKLLHWVPPGLTPKFEDGGRTQVKTAS